MVNRPDAKPEDFGDLLQKEESQPPILARSVRDALMEWQQEIHCKEELAEVGLNPRSRALFHGPPGVGKTTLAHRMAALLGLPMLAVRPERIVSKYMGDTAKNIGAVFDLCSDPEAPILLFLDEFDSLGFKRSHGSSNPVAQQDNNQSINTLLQAIDRHQGFVIAATNHGKDLDPAVWRRFQVHIQLENPGQDERRQILARYLKPYGLPKPVRDQLATSLETASPALIRQFCEGLKRNLVVGPKLGWNMQREAVIERILTAVQPHADAGKPRLWSKGSRDEAVRALPWPLPRLGEVSAGSDAEEETAAETAVVPFSRSRKS